MLNKLHDVRFNQTWSVALVCGIALLLIFSFASLNQARTHLDAVNKGTLYIEDIDAKLDLDTVLAMPDGQWEKETNTELVYGMTRFPMWFKFNVPAYDMSQQRILEIDYAMLDYVEVWYFEDNILVGHYVGGDSFAFDQRLIKNEKLLFLIPKAQGELTAIVKMQTEGTAKLPMRIWAQNDYLIFNGEHSLVLGLFFGFMAAMMLSNLFFYVTTGTITFLTYSLYVVSMALTLMTLHGLGFKYIWPDWVWLQSRSVGVFATLTILFVTIFSKQLLNVKAHSRIMNRLLKIAIWLQLGALVLSFIVPYHYYIMLFLVLLCASVTVVFATGGLLWVKGVKLARFYLLAWSALLFGGFISSFESAGLLNINISAQYVLMLGAAIETFMLAFALAIAYGQQRDEQFKQQELALLEERMRREAKEKALEIKEDAQEDLEYNVQERTLELEIALRELSDLNNELELQTLTDSLTGIRNRKHFDKKYRAEVRRSRREQTELSIVMLDIDHFKRINDNYGHVCGDEVIKHIASTLKKHLKRPSDDVCRYGGEEFAMILPSTDLKGAMLLAEALRKDIEENAIDIEEHTLEITMSAGVATTIVSSTDDEKALLEAADKSLYQAKRNGRNQVFGDHLHARDSV